MGKECDIGCDARPDVICFEPGIASRDGGHIYYNVCGTLRARPGDNMMTVCYAICSYNSNAWKSGNPHSGIYETEVSKTLDSANCCNTGCYQGGIAIVEHST